MVINLEWIFRIRHSGFGDGFGNSLAAGTAILAVPIQANPMRSAGGSQHFYFTKPPVVIAPNTNPSSKLLSHPATLFTVEPEPDSHWRINSKTSELKDMDTQLTPGQLDEARAQREKTTCALVLLNDSSTAWPKSSGSAGAPATRVQFGEGGRP